MSKIMIWGIVIIVLVVVGLVIWGTLDQTEGFSAENQIQANEANDLQSQGEVIPEDVEPLLSTDEVFEEIDEVLGLLE